MKPSSSGEADRVYYEKVKRNIEKFLIMFPQTDCLFILTDEDGFLDYMQQEFSNCSLVDGEYEMIQFRNSDLPIASTFPEFHQIIAL